MEEIIGNMEHTEVSRTLIDRILGRNKDIDKIVKIRKQITTIKKSFNDAKLTRRVGTFDNVYYKMFTLMNESVMDEVSFYNELGGEALLKKRIDLRDELVELLKDVIDVSDIQKEIREDKLKSIGI
jgi:nicotinamide mononucleotide adenylyltransferase